MFAGDVLAVFFAVIVGGFSLGQAGPNVEGLIVATAAAGEVFETIDRVRGGKEEGKCIIFILNILLLLSPSLSRSLHLIQILMKDSNLMISSHPLHFKMLCLDIQPDLMYQY